MNFSNCSFFVVLFALLLLCSNASEIETKPELASAEDLKEALSRQRGCPRCPGNCATRAVARRACRQPTCRRSRCVVRRDRNGCPNRNRQFRCAARASQTPQPRRCPNVCRRNEGPVIRECATQAIIRLGCRVRRCDFGAGITGFICALPGRMPPTPTPSSSPVTSAPPTRTPDMISVSPSVSPTPSPIVCTVTMRGVLNGIANMGTCMCGSMTRSVTLLRADNGGFVSQMCLDRCYMRLIEPLCELDILNRFIRLATNSIETCCENCGGEVVDELNLCR